MHLTFNGGTIKMGITGDITLDINLEQGGFLFMGSLGIGQTGVFYSLRIHKD